MRPFSLLIALAAAASAQTGPEILSSTADTYQSLKSYHFESLEVNELAGESNQSRTRSTRIAAVNPPDQRRLEVKGTAANLRVYDGHTVWEFRPGVNQFARFDQAAYTAPRNAGLRDPVDTYKALGKDAAKAKLLREETMAAAGGQRACWVVEVPEQFTPSPQLQERSPRTYWIDKSTHLVLKESAFVKFTNPRMEGVQTQTYTTTFSVARINEPLPEELFHFQPPQGASEVSEFTRPVGAGLPTGNTTSPDFALPDLSGKETPWSSFKGKPVVLSFWAVSCGPCREEMPQLQEAQKAFAEKGLIVLAINEGEAPEVAAKYIKEHSYTFPVLLDQNRAVGAKFLVDGIPTLVMIDKDGHIRDRITGYGAPLDFGEELKKMGVQ